MPLPWKLVATHLEDLFATGGIDSIPLDVYEAARDGVFDYSLVAVRFVEAARVVVAEPSSRRCVWWCCF